MLLPILPSPGLRCPERSHLSHRLRRCIAVYLSAVFDTCPTIAIKCFRYHTLGHIHIVWGKIRGSHSGDFWVMKIRILYQTTRRIDPQEGNSFLFAIIVVVITVSLYPNLLSPYKILDIDWTLGRINSTSHVHLLGQVHTVCKRVMHNKFEVMLFLIYFTAFFTPVLKLQRNTATRICAGYEQLRFRERIRVIRRSASVTLPVCFVYGSISHCHWGFS